MPARVVTKLILCLLIFLGTFWFSLPAALIGTSLAIKIEEDFRTTLKYRQAVRLIQISWRLRSCRCNANTRQMLLKGLAQRKYRLPAMQALELNKWKVVDVHCIEVIYKIKYSMTHGRFHSQRQIQLPSFLSDIAHKDDEILHRIDYIDDALADLSNVIDQTSGQLLLLKMKLTTSATTSSS